MGFKLTVFHEHDSPLFTQYGFNNIIYCVIYHSGSSRIIRRCYLLACFIHPRGVVEIFLY